jgi:predicted nucleic acid-binding protein
MRLPLLIDERRGNAIARRQGLTVLGTLWVLAEAKRQHIVPDVKPLVKAIRSSGYWLDDDLLTEFLREKGE